MVYETSLPALINENRTLIPFSKIYFLHASLILAVEGWMYELFTAPLMVLICTQVFIPLSTLSTRAFVILLLPQWCPLTASKIHGLSGEASLCNITHFCCDPWNSGRCYGHRHRVL